jgi:hypothetical protein
MEAIKEQVFYQDPNVTVTQARFVSRSKTYAMSNISSVSLGIIKRSKKLEIFMIAIGFILLVTESTRIVGAIMAAIGVLLLFVLKDTYSVRINSNSGEADGFISKDKDCIEKIVDAVNEAIIHRG